MLLFWAYNFLDQKKQDDSAGNSGPENFIGESEKAILAALLLPSKSPEQQISMWPKKCIT